MCHAIPGRIESIDGDNDLMRIGWVSFGGIEKNVSLACVPGAQEGDYVLVHAGLAIAMVDEDAARATLQHRPENGSSSSGA
jgi:hydrogenase expression/formation protein HypC